MTVCGEPTCELQAAEVRLPCPAGRPDASAAYCDKHGGIERAHADASRDWKYAAPASVGDAAAVERAGSAHLVSVHAYVTLRQLDESQGGVWLAWLGIGSMMDPVRNPTRGPRRNMSGAVNRSRSDGTRSFPGRDAAEAEALRVWRVRLDRDVEAIRKLRGGTLDWGVPVEPLDQPIVLVLEQGDRRSAWDYITEAGRAALKAI